MFGCSRVVLVSESSPIRIGPNCTTQIYSFVDGEWLLSPNKLTLQEGWYCVPPSFIDPPSKSSGGIHGTEQEP